METKKTVEETYRKLSQKQHVLERSGMYIGNIKKQLEEMWVVNTNNVIERKMINYSPGFLKIFDEILTNAQDANTRDPTVNTIKVDFNEETGEISVFNNGKGIPVVMHKENKVYVPELIFGHLLSGSNFNDLDTRTGSGTNGLGSKLTSLFSKSFTIETIDSDNKLKFVQEYTDNLNCIEKPTITKNTGKSYVKVSFIPDYKRFNMAKLNEVISLLKRRVYDSVVCTPKTTSIYLNGEKLKAKGLLDYIKFFNGIESEKVIYDSNENIKFTWEWAVVPSKEFNQVSFVNGNNTVSGGTHVNYILNQITNKLKALIEKRQKIKEVKPSFIKDRLFLFLRATIKNPTFNSQTKETLTTQFKDFGCSFQISDKYIDKLYKSSITEDIVKMCKLKENMDLAKNTDGNQTKRVFIDKLEDANLAGTKKSIDCSLFLTEGLSASKFAKDGKAVIGNDYYGVYSLKGKCLNVRDATTSQLINNEEINHLKQIIGLKQGVVYDSESIQKLRYGKIIILTDADQDGIAISALVMNIFHFWWPELIKLNFIQKMITPIVRAFNGKNTTDFYTLTDFNKYVETNKSHSTKYKYYKGLGTWEQKECKKLFENNHFKELLKQYIYLDQECDNAMKLAFEKTKEKGQLISWPDKRKEWLSKYDKSVYIKKEQKRISLKELVDNELIHFSVYDNLRSIPHYVDGLKPSQRKILYYMLKKNIIQDLKVAQLSGYVSAETSYHHGEMSLQKAIIAMAQNFIGSNNVNLLYPAGNFGSRNMNGADAASPRYTFTRLSTITKLLFNQQDDELLNYLEDDGTPIEPEYFEPIVPTLLVNGSEGIGTGYSTYIPSYNILEIIDNLLFIIKKNGNVEDSSELKMLIPYYKNFKGKIVADDENTGIFKMSGIYTKIDTCKIKITELPVNVHNYKAFIENKIQKQNKNSIVIKDYINNTRDDNIDIEFIVEFKDSKVLNKMIKDGTLNKELKLTSTISTNNMYVFDEDTHLVKYSNPNDLLLDFYDHRIDIYEKRRLHLMKKLSHELQINNNKIRFISEYLSNKIQINKKTKDELIQQLKDRKYDTIDNSF
jgi:DNA topoisomerase-2